MGEPDERADAVVGPVARQQVREFDRGCIGHGGQAIVGFERDQGESTDAGDLLDEGIEIAPRAGVEREPGELDPHGRGAAELLGGLERSFVAPIKVQPEVRPVLGFEPSETRTRRRDRLAARRGAGRSGARSPGRCRLRRRSGGQRSGRVGAAGRTD